MARPRHYVPAIGRFLVKVVHHEARNRGVPMTRLVDSLLSEALRGSEAWRLAEAETAAELAGLHDGGGRSAGLPTGGGRGFRPKHSGKKRRGPKAA